MDAQVQVLTKPAVCPNCGAEAPGDSRFCSTCGTKLVPHEVEFEAGRWQLARPVAVFFLINLITCAVLKRVSITEVAWLFMVDAFLAVVALFFFIYNPRQAIDQLKWPRFSALKLFIYIAMAIVASVIVSYLTSWLNIGLFSKDTVMYSFFEKYTYGPYLMVLSIAVTPAIFEELGYRGFLLNTLARMIGPAQAVYVSSFMFAIMHMSFLSLFWLIPFAVCLGYINIREKTLWYGVVIHFFFNLTASLLDMYQII